VCGYVHACAKEKERARDNDLEREREREEEIVLSSKEIPSTERGGVLKMITNGMSESDGVCLIV